MKRYLLTLAVAVSLAVTSIGIPGTPVKAESELDKVNKQLDAVKREMKKAQEAEKKAKNEIKYIQSKKEQYADQIAAIQKEIDNTSTKLQKLNKQIADVEQNLEYTKQELEEAQQRVVDRDALLKSRLKFLYMNGFVSYLDVLLSSTSFLDFLDRMDGLQSIVNQDKQILELNIADKQTVEMKKKDVEAQLDYVGQLLAETVELKKSLEKKQSDREVKLASIESREEELEEITEEQEKQLLKLADEQSKLIKKQNEIKAKNAKKKKKTSKYTGGQLLWPVPSSERITSEWGTRVHPITKRKHTHSGLDIGAPNGSTIVAAASGTVVLAQWYGGYGNCIIIEHKEGFRTLYAHIRSGGIKVKIGDEVERGQKIAEVGSTGSSTGNHLHFGVYVNNESVDPEPYLKK